MKYKPEDLIRSVAKEQKYSGEDPFKDDFIKMLARKKAEEMDYDDSQAELKKQAILRSITEAAEQDQAEKEEFNRALAEYNNKPKPSQEELKQEMRLEGIRNYIRKQKENRLPANELSPETQELMDELKNATESSKDIARKRLMEK